MSKRKIRKTVRSLMKDFFNYGKLGTDYVDFVMANHETTRGKGYLVKASDIISAFELYYRK